MIFKENLCGFLNTPPCSEYLNWSFKMHLFTTNSIKPPSGAHWHVAGPNIVFMHDKANSNVGKVVIFSALVLGNQSTHLCSSCIADWLSFYVAYWRFKEATNIENLCVLSS